MELEGEDHLLEEIERLNQYFLDFLKPKVFSPGQENAVIEHELHFEEIKSGMEESGIDTRRLTVFEFYARIQHFEKRNAELKNGSK